MADAAEQISLRSLMNLVTNSQTAASGPHVLQEHLPTVPGMRKHQSRKQKHGKDAAKPKRDLV